MTRPSVPTSSIRSRPGVATGFILAFILAASACGPGSSESTGAGSEDESAGAQYESPLGDFLGWTTDFDAEDEQAKYQEIERQAQEAAAVCMKAEGFEYTPIDNSQFDDFMVEQDGGLEWGSKEWVEKYGFGISTQRYSQAEVGPDLVGHDYPEFMEEEGEEYFDPNQEYVESLPEAEQQAYYETLYGKDEGLEYDPTLSDEENDALMEEYYNEDYVPTGCMNIAYEEASGGDSDSYQAFDEQFGEELDELYERMESDPRVAEYQAKVSSCVSDKGFVYTDEESVYEDIEERMSSFDNNRFDDDPFDGVDPETLSDEEIDAIFNQLNAISDEDKVKLAEVQEYELALAAAVVECSGGYLFSHQDPELSKIRIELEQEFLDKNADALKEFEGIAGGR